MGNETDTMWLDDDCWRMDEWRKISLGLDGLGDQDNNAAAIIMTRW